MRSPRLILAAALASAAFGAQAQAPAAQPAAAAPAAAPAAPAAPAPVKGNAEAGKNKVYQCQGCHGIADWKTAFPEVYRVPKLGGQKEAYIVSALKAYRSGEREFPTMRGMVMDMSDQDMADVAAYYAAGGPAPAMAKK